MNYRHYLELLTDCIENGIQVEENKELLKEHLSTMYNEQELEIEEVIYYLAKYNI